MKKKQKKKPGRKRLIDGQPSEFIGFFIPQSMRELIDVEASYNDLNLSRQMRKIITDYFEKEGETHDH